MRPEIFTERLELLPSEDERDLESFTSDLLLTDDFYFQYGVPYSDELLRAIDFHSSGVIYYSVFLKGTRTMVGYVGVLLDEDDSAYGEIEFYIFRDFRRQGFCKEALTAFTDAFFTGALTGVKGKQAIAETLTKNEAVIKLLENMGFEREAWGMRLSLSEGGEIDRDNTVLGLYRYILNSEAIREGE